MEPCGVSVNASNLLNVFFVPFVLLVLIVLRLRGGRRERGHEMPEDVVQTGGLDHIAEQPVEGLTDTHQTQGRIGSESKNC